MVGVCRTTIGFPLEHPIDAIKTQWQAKAHFRNEIEIVRHIWQTKGFFAGFYAGSLPNYFRCVLRNSYRYPLMIGLPNFYRTHLPKSVCEDKMLTKFLTGISIAFIESVIMCPVEL